MAPSTLAETITVTGEVATRRNDVVEVAGNIDPRQITELPSQGRNWMSLALLAPGNRTNAQGATPVRTGRRSRISAECRWTAGHVEPRHRQPGALQQRRDRGVRVHLEPVRRDAGPFVRRAGERRSPSRAPTTSPARSSATSATAAGTRQDPVLNRVLPYSNQQISGTAGGPIIPTSCTTSATTSTSTSR